jgi:hypothetical protein
MSKRDRVLAFGLVVPLSASLMTFVVGPTYLEPLPTWLKLVIAGACACVIAALAVFSRRRARRAAPSNSP